MKPITQGLTRAYALLIAVGVALGLATPTLLNVLIPPATLRANLTAGPPGTAGPFDPAAHVYGFFAPEAAPDGATYRWTGSHATVTFPYAANMGRHAVIALRIADFVAGQPPASVTFSANGVALSTLIAPATFQDYTYKLDTQGFPNPYLHADHIQVDITSNTRSTPQDARELGVAVGLVALRMEKSRTEIAMEAAAWAASIFIVLLAASLRLPRRWGLVYGAAALCSLALVHLTYMPRAISLPVMATLAGVAWAIAAWLAPRGRPGWGLGLGALGVWLVMAGWLLRDWEIDDAYISYRYAWNLVHGNGLVYNPGEVVEGYTNFLWTLLSAAGIALGQHPAELMLAATIASSLALLGITYHLGAKLAGQQRYVWPLFAAALLAVDVDLLTYGARGSGVEAVTFSMFALLAVALLWREAAGESRLTAWRASAGLVFALATLTRPEGLLLAALLPALRAWQDRRAGRRAWPLLVAALIPYLVVVAPYQAWRMLFYGYPLPNTFYAKTGASIALFLRGAEYAWAFVLGHWLLSALALLGLAWAALRWRSHRPGDMPGPDVTGSHARSNGRVELRVALGLLVTVYTLYVIAVGGDWFPSYRFFVPLLAPLALIAQEAGRTALAPTRLQAPATHLMRAGLAIALFSYATYSLSQQGLGSDLARRIAGESAVVENWGGAGLWLRDHSPPATVTASEAAGAIAYYSLRPVIDIFGLNDLHIARAPVADLGIGKPGHEKGDPVYVLDKRPDYILVSGSRRDYFAPVEERISREYAQEIVRSPVGLEVRWLRRAAPAGTGP